MNNFIIIRTTISIFIAVFYYLNTFGQTNIPFQELTLAPIHNAININPDTHLKITFPMKPKLGNTGQIRIYDASNDSLVDVLDLSIPPGPKNTRTIAPYDSMNFGSVGDKLYTVYDPDTSTVHKYQKNYIGGRTEAEAFHFYPILIHDKIATICLHNNVLKYNKTYYVQIDPGVFTLKDELLPGISKSKSWVFNTKKVQPSDTLNQLVVSSDGKGDFNTVQGAIDFIPENNASRKTIFIKNGIYEEIVYFHKKQNVTFKGESRDNVIICYANNGVFNFRQVSPDPNEKNEFHYQRAVFMADQSDGIHITNLTLKSIGEEPAQAEALLILGNKNIIDNVTIDGSGDALQATGTIYVTDSSIKGFGDNVLGYGAVFFNKCDFISTFGPHLWVRNTEENHGNVLLNCTLRTINNAETVIARAPINHGIHYNYCEAVLLNCAIEGISDEGWGKVCDDTSNIHYWEYNTTHLSDGKPVDVSKRHPASRQLTMKNDSVIIANYCDPAFILKGWNPILDID